MDVFYQKKIILLRFIAHVNSMTEFKHSLDFPPKGFSRLETKNMSGLSVFFFIVSISLFSCANTNEVIDDATGDALCDSTTGLQFSKVKETDETFKLIYDCSAGKKGEGVIELFDNNHPEKVTTVIIENCNNITVSAGENKDEKVYSPGKTDLFRELIIKNITTLKLKNTECCSEAKNNQIKQVHIIDVQNLMLEENSFKIFTNVSLKLQNTTIPNLKRRQISKGIVKLHLQDVKIKELEELGIVLDSPEGIFTIRDTHFDYIGQKAFLVDGLMVEVFNNSFNYLDNDAFYVNSSEKFIFADNHVENMQSPFNVRSPNVQIVGNTFNNIRAPWLSGITVGDYQQHLEGTPRTLNISKNSMKLFPEEFYELNPRGVLDVISFNDNIFHCSCQYWNFNNVIDPNGVMHILLRKSSNNVCVNFDNCTVYAVLKNMRDVCDETFKCSEGETKTKTEVYLEKISSTIEKLAAKLECLQHKVNSPTASTETIPVTENLIDSESG